MNKVKVSAVIFLIVLTASVLFAVQHSYAGVPQLINYQGKLTDKNGDAVLNGNYNVVFKIYDVPSGGTALWTETWDSSTIQIKTVGGVFNAMLGTHTTIPVTFFSQNQTTYLGITVGTDSEMIPRQKITSVGYAFEAGNGVPQGAIMMWNGGINQIPAGWALCDGTNGTPDLRDRFIVGAGKTYNDGATGGEANHILTINEMPSHTHIQNPHAHQTGVNRQSKEMGGNNFYMPDNYPGPNGDVTSSSVTATNQYTGGGTAHNNLPPYYSLAFIMKL